MSCRLTRRAALLGLSCAALSPRNLLAGQTIALNWSDLLPEGEVFVPSVVQGLIDHDGPSLVNQQPASSGVRMEWDGKTVRLEGFVVPIEYRGTGVSAFVLVPFVGACVHVPPPPANQLVFVTTNAPFDSKGLYEPVSVTGRLGIASLTTDVAEVSYNMAADLIEPFTY